MEFSEWYARESTRVTMALRAALLDDDLADECVAKAFARARLHWSRVQCAGSPRAWVYTVAMNHARSILRRRRLERRATSSYLEGTYQLPPDFDDDLWSAVRGLNPRARQAIALRYIADLPEAEVAAIMGIARGTVAATLSKARATLAAALDPELVRGLTE